MNYIILQIVAFFFALIYASFFEWTLHRFFMHRITWGIVYPFKSHAQVHHKVFKSDHTYLIQRPEDEHLITFAWWNYPLLLGLNAPFILGLELIGFRVSLGVVLGMSVYYALYEYLHFAMHKPLGRFFEGWKFFQFINRHHRIHHKYMHRNLNVVMPLADLSFRTLILHPKSPITAGEPELRPIKKAVPA